MIDPSLHTDSLVADRYRVIKRIGQGGMGQVFLAQDEQLDRPVAIKQLRGDEDNAKALHRFQREAKFLAKLNHPCIVQVYDYVTEENGGSLIMEYIDGVDLARKLREEATSMAQRLQWLYQIMAGLACAHASGILHRDLKPENILVSRNGNAKLTDFGIAREQQQNTELTQAVIGSYAYMSPEQIADEPLDFKSDLFSFGIVAYSVLLEQHPFGATGNTLKLLQNISTGPLNQDALENSKLPDELKSLLQNLLAKDKTARPDSSQQVCEQLAYICQEYPLSETLEGGMETAELPPLTLFTRHTAQALPLPKPRKRHWLTVTATLLIAVAAGVWFTGQGSAPGLIPQAVAVLPPRFSTDGELADSDQRLVGGTLYQAAQQSVVQLPGTEAIPRFEVDSQTGEPFQILTALAAKELIVTDVFCNLTWCDISINRLAPAAQGQRLKVLASANFRTTVDRYAMLAERVHLHINQLYDYKSDVQLDLPDENEYRVFAEQYQQYYSAGANTSQLDALDTLSTKTKAWASVQILYREIALDLYHDTGNDQALTRLEQFLPAKNRTDTEAQLLNQFALARSQKDFAQARHWLERLEQQGLDHSALMELEGLLALSESNYPVAIDNFRQSAQLRPSVHNYFRLSMASWLNGDIEPARDYISRAHQLNPADHKTNRFRGVIALWEGRLDEAHEALSQALESERSAIVLNNLGVVLLLQGDYNGSKKQLQDALKIAPGDEQTLFNLADAHKLNGELKTAQGLYTQVAEQTATFNDAYSLRLNAQALAHLGQYSEAIAAYQQARELDPDSGDTHYTGALVYALAGEKISARLSTQAALKSGMGEAWFALPWFSEVCDEQQVDCLAL
ncbi:serine/threonine-protein kinase [Gilvimarinus chinensis]|uniref:serine/threonine-protein kinase n=1 Tax=Gilvimarinus chinensis TaxID=396005 RepID=UPI00036AB544|nr:serine/threonine-protein kinase [Gilvimarinus chinensis]